MRRGGGEGPAREDGKRSSKGIGHRLVCKGENIIRNLSTSPFFACLDTSIDVSRVSSSTLHEQGSLLPNYYAVSPYEELFILRDRKLFCVDMKHLAKQGKDKEWKEVVSDVPSSLGQDKMLPAGAKNLTMSADGSLLAVSSDSDCVVYFIPRLRGRASTSETLVCRTRNVGDNFDFPNKAIRIRQVSWHPHSPSHLVILTTDSIIRIVNITHSAKDIEQQFQLESGPHEAHLDLRAFCFGKGSGWDMLTMYVMSEGGVMHSVCPVLPFRWRVKKERLPFLSSFEAEDCPDDLEATSKAWLLKAFEGTDDDEWVVSSPFTEDELAEWKPSFQGPFDVQPSTTAIDPGVAASSILCLAEGNGPHAIAASFTNGSLLIFVKLRHSMPNWIKAKRFDSPPYAILYHQVVLPVLQGKESHPYLLPDPTFTDAFYVSHDTGVNMCQLPWLKQLEKWNEKKDANQYVDKLEKTICRVLVSDKCFPRPSHPSNPTQPLAIQVVNTPTLGHLLLLMLHDRSFRGQLIQPQAISKLSLNKTLDISDPAPTAIAADLLLATARQLQQDLPTLKLGPSIDANTVKQTISHVSSVSKSHLALLMQLQQDISQSAKTIAEVRKSQKKRIRELRQYRQNLDDRSKKLTESLEDLRSGHKDISLELARLNASLAEQEVGLSKAEEKWLKELLTVRKPRVEVNDTRLNELAEKIEKILGLGAGSLQGPSLSSSQLDRVGTALSNYNDDIHDMIRQVRAMQVNNNYIL